MRFITALAFERRGFIVTSGMSATAGERKVAIETSTKSKSNMKISGCRVADSLVPGICPARRDNIVQVKRVYHLLRGAVGVQYHLAGSRVDFICFKGY